MALESSPEVLNSLLAKLGAPGSFKVKGVGGFYPHKSMKKFKL